jgi:signal transduction histidine kinase
LGAAFAVAIVLLLSLVYAETANYLTRRVDQSLGKEVESFVRSSPTRIVPLIDEESARDHLNSFGLFSATGERVAGDTWLTPRDFPKSGAARDFPPRAHAGAARAVLVLLPWGETLIVARDISQIVELRRIILGALIWSGALIVVLGLFTGVALSIGPVRRIQAVQNAADEIVQGDFSIRLPVSSAGDELDALAHIVNAMIDDVERLLVESRAVGESVAHELRTPLTRLRATLSHASQALETDDPRREMLEACVGETESVLMRFNSLLRIAALEAKGRREGIGRVSLSALVEQVGELFAPLALERNIALCVQVTPEIAVPADAELMFEALCNLMDNALKFTNPGGCVRLSLRREGGAPLIEVADNGVGIPQADRLLVTRRFYRSRAHAQTPGHGLGLSLVEAVVNLHRFELSFEDAEPGAVVQIRCRPPSSVIGAQ